jgi:hypothetical protein
MAPILGMDRVLSDYMATTDTPQDRKELELGGNILMFFSGFAHDPQAASVVARIPRITASLIWELCAGFVASASKRCTARETPRRLLPWVHPSLLWYCTRRSYPTRATLRLWLAGLDAYALLSISPSHPLPVVEPRIPCLLCKMQQFQLFPSVGGRRPNKEIQLTNFPPLRSQDPTPPR